MNFLPFIILIAIHFFVMMHCAQYMRDIKEKAIADGMSEVAADDHARYEYKSGLYKRGHPMFKIGIYNILFVAALLFSIVKFTPLLSILT